MECSLTAVCLRVGVHEQFYFHKDFLCALDTKYP